MGITILYCYYVAVAVVQIVNFRHAICTQQHNKKQGAQYFIQLKKQLIAIVEKFDSILNRSGCVRVCAYELE